MVTISYQSIKGSKILKARISSLLRSRVAHIFALAGCVFVASMMLAKHRSRSGGKAIRSKSGEEALLQSQKDKDVRYYRQLEKEVTAKSWKGWKIESGKYAHDDPDHPLHWMREKGPDPALAAKKDCKGDTYASLYERFHKDGYVIIQSCSLENSETLQHVSELTKGLFGRITREQDAWAHSEHVARLATDPDILNFLEYLHGGRRVYPFQTLNFPEGTQQPLHSDVVHFDTLPQRGLMAAAWTALEDMNADNGPLIYYPGSHQWGLWDLWDFDELKLWQSEPSHPSYTDFPGFYARYEQLLEKYLKESVLKPAYSSGMKYGQTLIWSASLVHGGSQRKDTSLSRLSQVTHYFFEGAENYFVPRLSNIKEGVHLKHDLPMCEPASLISPAKSQTCCADQFLTIWNSKANLDAAKSAEQRKGFLMGGQRSKGASCSNGGRMTDWHLAAQKVTLTY